MCDATILIIRKVWWIANENIETNMIARRKVIIGCGSIQNDCESRRWCNEFSLFRFLNAANVEIIRI